MPKFYEPEVLKKVRAIELNIFRDFIAFCEKHNLEYFGIAGTGIGAVRHKGFIPWDDDIDVAMPRKDFEKFLVLAKEELSDEYLVLNGRDYREFPLMTTHLVKKGTRFVNQGMEKLDCPFGIFLDIFPMDNVADGERAFHRQAWSAWFWNKLLILRNMSRPYLGFTGWKKMAAYGCCSVGHWTLKLLHIPQSFLYRKCENACRKYEGQNTKRMAFLPDTNPFWNIVDKTGMYPLQMMEFEDFKVAFPKNLDELLRMQYGDYMVLPPVEKRKTHYPAVLDFGEEG